MIGEKFIPYASQALVTGAASAAVALGKGDTVRLFNNSTFPVFVRLGGPAVVAVAGDTGIPPNGVQYLSASPCRFAQDNQITYEATAYGPTFIAAISPGGGTAATIRLPTEATAPRRAQRLAMTSSSPRG